MKFLERGLNKKSNLATLDTYRWTFPNCEISRLKWKLKRGIFKTSELTKVDSKKFERESIFLE